MLPIIYRPIHLPCISLIAVAYEGLSLVNTGQIMLAKEGANDARLIKAT
jgi:hypothetical protein